LAELCDLFAQFVLIHPLCVIGDFPLGVDEVELSLDMKPRVSRRFNRSMAVERGPLVFFHSPGENWVKLRDRPPTADWEVFPRNAWNYALEVEVGGVRCRSCVR
jgi:hypothetical protein